MNIRKFYTSSTKLRKVTPTNLKGKSVSSQNWLTRQLSDPYVEKAKMLNYRCRSAFKLLEIDDKYKFLHPGQTVVDCGAAPGSWTQVAIKRANSDGSMKEEAIGKVISIDRQFYECLYQPTSIFFPFFHGATILGNMDFTTKDCYNKLLEILGGQKVNVVLSDMAPKATGIRDLDNENIINLCYSTLKFALLNSALEATLLVKLWQCGQTKNFENELRRFYNTVNIVKPGSSRSDSAEIFLLARNFKGIKSS